MSDRSEKFFAWVWRLNGLLVLILALLCLAGAVAVMVGILSPRERPEDKLAQVAGADLSQGDLRLTDFRPIVGTQLLYAELTPPSEYNPYSSGGSRGSRRNVLFFDTVTKKAHWLFPGNDQTIQSLELIADPATARYQFDDGEPEGLHRVAIAILLEVQDSTDEQRASRKSDRRLLLATPDGRTIVKLVESVEGMLGYHQANKDSVFLFYISGSSARVLHMDPTRRVVLSDDLLSTDERGALPN